MPRLYAIIDAAQAGDRSPLEICEALLSAGVRLVQFRGKSCTGLQLFEYSQRLAERTRRARGLFIVNDRADVALAAGADGVHVGQEDLAVESVRQAFPRVVGLSTHNLTQVREGDQSGADYIAIGPIFPTLSKERPGAEVGLEGLRAARKATGKPLVAIGGINLANAQSVVEAGADSLAVIGAILRTPDVAQSAREFLHLLG